MTTMKAIRMPDYGGAEVLVYVVFTVEYSVRVAQLKQEFGI